jgi:hypothetical protein
MRHWLLATCLSLAVGCGGDDDGSNPGSDGGGGGDDGGGGDAGTSYVPPWGDCAGGDEQPPPDDSLCLFDEADPQATDPVAVIEYEFVTYMSQDAVHITLIFDPDFADNTYGANAVGWVSHDHKFGDLVGSDHAVIVALDKDGNPVFDLAIDYLSQDDAAPCGYSSLGPFGGEGDVNLGDPEGILGWQTSISENLNDRGYCEDYLVDSPATDASCTPNADAPNWDYRVVYELWLALSAFDPSGFGSAYMTEVHASPSKYDTNTVEVDPGECDNADNCQDPDGCGSGDCVDSGGCDDYEFCYDGECVPVVE